IYQKNKALYDADRLAGIQSDKRSIPEVRATVVLLGACQDKEVSWERGGHGLFTSAMITEWDGGFRGSYRELFDRVSERVKPSQHPNLFAFGPATDELKKAPAFQK
ncbi:MAG TPA: caspase family protein, partial [Gemmataceae bacterium]|nr:caspase family protein [Gemmataceae bacterium]